MKLRSDYFVAIIAVIGWAVVAWVVIDYNLGLGSTTLRWPNPAHPTAAWTWDAREVTPSILEPQAGQWLRVTLPRGFVGGTLQVRTKEAGEIILHAEPRSSAEKITSTSNSSAHTLSFTWKNLIARGRTYRFRLENPTTTPITISNISLIVSRSL